jgi:hypothetical protein
LAQWNIVKGVSYNGAKIAVSTEGAKKPDICMQKRHLHMSLTPSQKQAQNGL